MDATQLFVQQYASSRFRPLVAEKVATASYELMSNALNFGSVSGDVVFELSASVDQVFVRVENDAIASRAAVLREHVERARSAPEKTYLEEMGKSVGENSRRSRLGLARVVFEVGMRLEMTHKDQRVVVTASTST